MKAEGGKKGIMTEISKKENLDKKGKYLFKVGQIG